jgi:hypothetical protein
MRMANEVRQVFNYTIHRRDDEGTTALPRGKLFSEWI